MTNEPAFPFENSEGHRGMTLRDYFAGQALQIYPDIEVQANIKQAAEELGIGEKDYSYVRDYPKLVAKRCYQMADAMLAEREKGAL
jgi:hypothetical protein